MNSDTPHGEPNGSPKAPHPLSLEAPPTRREVLLFGLLILAVAWLTLGPRPRIVHVVPESPLSLRVVT